MVGLVRCVEKQGGLEPERCKERDLQNDNKAGFLPVRVIRYTLGLGLPGFANLEGLDAPGDENVQ